MKIILSLCCAAVLSAPLLVSAADVKTGAGKNNYLLNSATCSGQSYSIQEIIAQLQAELRKGTSVYTTEEIEHLAAKLAEYEQFEAAMNN